MLHLKPIDALDVPCLVKVSPEGFTSFRGSTCNMSWNVDRAKYCSWQRPLFGNMAECQCFDNLAIGEAFNGEHAIPMIFTQYFYPIFQFY